ncbi:MAG: hypothetical protein AAF664_06320 [Planctomycetota bacterium]
MQLTFRPSNPHAETEMNMPDLSDFSLSTRLLAAGITFIVLAGVAAVGVVFAMMLVLLSADGTSTSQFDQRVPSITPNLIAGSLIAAVVLPPIMMIFKASPIQSLIPAGIGFVSAGIGVLTIVMRSLGNN